MKKSFIIGGAVAILAALLPAAAAEATGAVVGGGNWNYGVQSGTVYSNYFHASKYHSATACNSGLFDRCHASYANGGTWANASVGASWSGNTAYWNTY